MGYEVDFLPVGTGNGDAICIRYGNALTGFQVHVVDGAFADTGDRIIEHIKKYYGAPTKIDRIVLTHADDDHVGGLLKVMEHFEVGALYVNRPWLYVAEVIDSFHGNYTVDGLVKAFRDGHPKLVELEALAAKKKVPIFEAFTGARIGAFTVLSPTRDRYLELIPDMDRTPTYYGDAATTTIGKFFEAAAKAVQTFFETWTSESLSDNPPATSASNESSIVQAADIDGQTIVLTADAGPTALSNAAAYATSIGLKGAPAVVQIPHHGSRRNVTPTVLNAWLGKPVPEGTVRGSALVSVGDKKSDYPRKRVSNAFTRRGYNVIATRGSSKSSFHGLPGKPGWGPATPEPFSPSFEE